MNLFLFSYYVYKQLSSLLLYIHFVAVYVSLQALPLPLVIL